MTAAFLVKHAGALRATDEASEKLLQGVAQGEVVKVEISRPRNVKHQRLFFALLTKVVENSSVYETREQLLTALKIALGHVDTIIGHDGKTYFVPRSIAFDSMDQDEFREFFERCADIIVRRFLPGVSKPELRNEILNMVGATGSAR